MSPIDRPSVALPIRLCALAGALTACAPELAQPPTTPTFEFDVPAASRGADTPPAVPDKFGGGGAPCAVVYGEPGFIGPSTTVSIGVVADAVGPDRVASLVVAPDCALSMQGGPAIEAGYHPHLDRAGVVRGCDCLRAVAHVADLGDDPVDWERGNRIPLFDRAPVDLAAIGWSTRANALRFTADSALVTLIGRTDGPDGERPSVAVADPSYDEDGDAVLDLSWELFRSVPARGYPVLLAAQVDVVEASLVRADPELWFFDCRDGECAPGFGEHPEGAF